MKLTPQENANAKSSFLKSSKSISAKLVSVAMGSCLGSSHAYSMLSLCAQYRSTDTDASSRHRRCSTSTDLRLFSVSSPVIVMEREKRKKTERKERNTNQYFRLSQARNLSDYFIYHKQVFPTLFFADFQAFLSQNHSVLLYFSQHNVFTNFVLHFNPRIIKLLISNLGKN